MHATFEEGVNPTKTHVYERNRMQTSQNEVHGKGEFRVNQCHKPVTSHCINVKNDFV